MAVSVFAHRNPIRFERRKGGRGRHGAAVVGYVTKAHYGENRKAAGDKINVVASITLELNTAASRCRENDLAKAHYISRC